MSKGTMLSFVFALCAMIGFSQVPGTLSYQGLLLDASNNPVPDGPNTITFRFYDVETGGTYDATIGERTLSVQTFKGLFTVILGDGTAGNLALPSLVGSQQYWIGVTPLGGSELTPRVRLSTVPYAFKAQTVNAVDAATITTGTVPNAQLDADLQDLADGSLSGSLIGSGINGANVGTGINGANVGTGINTANITTGTLAVANGGTGAATSTAARTNLGVVIGTNVQAYDADLDDLADGALTGSKVGSGINAANIVGSGTLPSSVLPATVGFSAAHTAVGSVSSQTCCPILVSIVQGYDSPSSNTGNAFNSASGLFTAPSNGWYSFIAQIAFANSTSQGAMFPYFQAGRSGSPYKSWYMNSFSTFAGSTRISGAIHAYLLAGDTMGVYFGQANGASISYSTDGSSFFFQGVRIGN